MTILTGLLAWLLAGAGLGSPTDLDTSCVDSGSSMMIAGDANICEPGEGSEEDADDTGPLFWDFEPSSKISNGF